MANPFVEDDPMVTDDERLSGRKRGQGLRSQPSDFQKMARMVSGLDTAARLPTKRGRLQTESQKKLDPPVKPFVGRTGVESPERLESSGSSDRRVRGSLRDLAVQQKGGRAQKLKTVQNEKSSKQRRKEQAKKSRQSIKRKADEASRQVDAAKRANAEETANIKLDADEEFKNPSAETGETPTAVELVATGSGSGDSIVQNKALAEMEDAPKEEQAEDETPAEFKKRRKKGEPTAEEAVGLAQAEQEVKDKKKKLEDQAENFEKDIKKQADLIKQTQKEATPPSPPPQQEDEVLEDASSTPDRPPLPPRPQPEPTSQPAPPQDVISGPPPTEVPVASPPVAPPAAPVPVPVPEPPPVVAPPEQPIPGPPIVQPPIPPVAPPIELPQAPPEPLPRDTPMQEPPPSGQPAVTPMETSLPQGLPPRPTPMDATSESTTQEALRTIQEIRQQKDAILQDIRNLWQVDDLGIPEEEIESADLGDLQAFFNQALEDDREQTRIQDAVNEESLLKEAAFANIEKLVPKSEADIYRTTFASLPVDALNKKLLSIGADAIKDAKRERTRIAKEQSKARAQLEFDALETQRAELNRQEAAAKRIFEIARIQAKQAAGNKGIRVRRKRSSGLPPLSELRAVIKRRRRFRQRGVKKIKAKSGSKSKSKSKSKPQKKSVCVKRKRVN